MDNAIDPYFFADPSDSMIFYQSLSSTCDMHKSDTIKDDFLSN